VIFESDDFTDDFTKRDSKRRQVLDELTRAEAEDGLYDLEPPDHALSN
jgi:hypothetical protein